MSFATDLTEIRAELLAAQVKFGSETRVRSGDAPMSGHRQRHARGRIRGRSMRGVESKKLAGSVRGRLNDAKAHLRDPVDLEALCHRTGQIDDPLLVVGPAVVDAARRAQTGLQPFHFDDRAQRHRWVRASLLARIVRLSARCRSAGERVAIKRRDPGLDNRPRLLLARLRPRRAGHAEAQCDTKSAGEHAHLVVRSAAERQASTSFDPRPAAS